MIAMRPLLLLLLLPFCGAAQNFIIPQPANIEWNQGKYSLPKKCFYYTDSKNTQLIETILFVAKEIGRAHV